MYITFSIYLCKGNKKNRYNCWRVAFFRLYYTFSVLYQPLFLFFANFYFYY